MSEKFVFLTKEMSFHLHVREDTKLDAKQHKEMESPELVAKKFPIRCSASFG